MALVYELSKPTRPHQRRNKTRKDSGRCLGLLSFGFLLICLWFRLVCAFLVELLNELTRLSRLSAAELNAALTSPQGSLCQQLMDLARKGGQKMFAYSNSLLAQMKAIKKQKSMEHASAATDH